MIKINLLPEVKRKAIKKKKVAVSRQIPFTWIIAGLAVVLVTCALLALHHMQLVEEHQVVQKKITDMQSEISKLKVQQGLVEKARMQRNELAQKLEIINTLKKRQTGPVQLMSQLAAATPRRVWLSEMSEAGTALTLTGFAVDHRQIALFMEKLQISPMFSEIELIRASSSTMSSGIRGGAPVPMKEFELTCNVSYAIQ